MKGVYESLRIVDFVDVAKDIVERIGQAKAGSKVLVITDTNGSLRIVESLMAASHMIGAEPMAMIIMPGPYPGRYDLAKSVLAAIREADVTIAFPMNSISHSQAAHDCCTALGHNWISMNGMTETTMLSRAILISGTEKLKEITDKAKAAIDGKIAHVTSENGTDVTFELSGRPFSAWGQSKPNGGNYQMCPNGEAGNAPIRDSVNGTIVIDGMQEGCMPLRWPYDYPITYKLKNGKIVEISGGNAAKVFERLLREQGDEGVWYLGEFAIGSNPEALLTGACQEDKHALGTLHFSPGDGALNKSKMHLDGIIIKPTLTIDKKVVIDKGVPKFL